ncbi:helicase [Microbacterium rhizomatis]|uniref:Helicase n=1 Tax=Microbacterium rhizomatis TaxID=1631477 RepID=A0A5J5IZP8_9MICO|nr:helicase [Microbacterium rhizomatis]KAA9107567.1 helicase [Microbacterium rhizomatis]
MPGTMLAAGVVACSATLAVGLVTAGAAAVFAQRLAGAADAAALAAADAGSGAVPGVPCDRAAEIAAAGGAVVLRCELEGLVATVIVGAEFARLPATAAARAGPPP